MTLSPFNPRILNFIYELGKMDSYKSSTEIAKSIKLEGEGSVTPKTVRNWFRYLRKPYKYMDYRVNRKLSYFPCTFKNKLGLSMINVFFEDPHPDLFKIFPLRNFVGWLYDPRINKPILAIEYVVPGEHIRDFLFVLSEIKNNGLCSYFNYYNTGPSFKITSPLQKVIGNNGVFHVDKNDHNEIDEQVISLEKFLELDFKVDMLNVIKRNPLIIPVLAEYMYEQRSSIQVWEAIKSKLGKSTWNYIKRFRRKTDGVGLRRVQSIMNNLVEFGLLNQMRVVYFPLEIERNFFLYSVIQAKNRGDLIEKVREFSLNSVFTNVFPMGRKALLISLVNGESMQKLFGLLSSIKVEKILFLDYPKSLDILTKTTYSTFDYTKLFDTQTCSWKYDQNAIIEEIESLK